MLRVLACCVLLVACKKTVDTKGFEKTLEAKIKSLGLQPTMVHCAKDVEAKIGTSFTCQVEIDKTTYDVEAKITSVNKDSDDVGLSMSWVRGDALVAKVIAEGATKTVGDAVGGAVTVDCGDKPLLFVENGAVTCTAISGRTWAPLILQVDDKLAVTTWKLEKTLIRAKLEEAVLPSLRAQSTPDAKVNCGADLLVIRPDDGFVPCTAQVGAEVRRIRVVVSPDLTIEKWEAVPPT